MQCQHELLHLVQKLLEECCFKFAKRWIPDTLVEEGYTCSIAVELNCWPAVINQSHSKLPEEATTALTKSSLKTIIEGASLNPHRAVHRLLTNAKGIARMLTKAI